MSLFDAFSQWLQEITNFDAQTRESETITQEGKKVEAENKTEEENKIEQSKPSTSPLPPASRPSNLAQKKSRSKQRAKNTNGSTICFNTEIVTHEIPSLEEFTKDELRRTWYMDDEAYKMIEKNVIEYRAEGWNWNSVIEEDQMIVDNITGQLVHPVHRLKAVAPVTFQVHSPIRKRAKLQKRASLTKILSKFQS